MTTYILAEPVAVSEGAPFVDVVVRLSAPSPNEVRVNYSTSAGTASSGGSTPDYLHQSGTLVFAPGETTETVRITLRDNTIAEPTEVFWLDLTSPVNAVVAQRFTAVTIFDNDGATGTPALSVSDVVVDETAHTASFFVWLNRPSLSTVTVNYGTADDTARAGQDYVATSGTLSFAPGEMVKTVKVNLIDDALPEKDEFFKLVLSNPGNATLAQAAGTAMIGRNDTPPVSQPYVLATPVAVSEGAPYVDVIVQLSAPSPNEVRVNYSTSAGTASSGGSTPDYLHQSGTLVFAPGETTETVRITLRDNTIAEPTEVFWLDLTSPVNAVVAQRFTAVTIFDNDGATGTPALSVSDVVVDETAHTASFFVWLNRPSLSTVTVNYGTADDTARAGQDYVATSGTLSFAPGEMVKTVKVNLIDDALPEKDEFFKLVLSNPGNATLAQAAGTAMIGRNDTPPVSQPYVLATPVAVSEGAPYVDVIVQLSAPSPNEVRVNYSTSAGTASSGGSTPDYQHENGTLVFAPGETTKTVRVALLDNTVVESTEVFSLDLTSPVNATVAQRFTTATIVDDDDAGTMFSYGISNDIYTITSPLDRIAEGPRGGIDSVFASVSYTLPEHVENIILTGGANLNATGNAGNNVMRGNSGNNIFDGQDGIDTAVFSGPMANYTISAGPNSSRIVSSAADGTDKLISIERLQFADAMLAFDTRPADHTYLAYAMFNAGFNRGPDVDELSLWTSTLDRLDGSTRDLAQVMINHYAPGVPNDVLIAHLWSTIVGGTIPPSALTLYTGLLVDGTYTQASLLDFVAGLPENTSEIVDIVGQTLSLDPIYFLLPAG